MDLSITKPNKDGRVPLGTNDQKPQTGAGGHVGMASDVPARFFMLPLPAAVSGTAGLFLLPLPLCL